MLGLLLCVICVVYVWWYMCVPKSKHALPPAFPGQLPIIGHTHLLIFVKASIWWTLKVTAKFTAQNGGVTYAKIVKDIYYFITDPQDALTASNACMAKHFAYDYARPWLGDGLLTSKGEIWRRHRKLLTPAFSLPIIHGYMKVFNSQSKRLISDLDPFIGKGLFDQTKSLRFFAIETLCIGTFGINPIEDRNFTARYMNSLDTMLQLYVTRSEKFWLQNDWIFKMSRFAKMEQEIIDDLHGMADEVLQRKKFAMKNEATNNEFEVKTTGIKYRPFMDLLVELSKEGALTDQEIKEEIGTVMAAGFETISNQMAFTLLFLGAYPEAQEKLYEEIKEVVGTERDVEKDDINKLVYTNAVIMESVRLLPSVPVLPRSVNQDVKLKNYTLRAGSYCLLYPLATQLDPSWGPAARKFKPERWLNNDVTLNSKEFAGFSLGRRVCIGQTYAITAMKVALAHLIRRYKITANMSNLKLEYEYLLKAVSGNEISLERRTSSSEEVL